MLSHRRVAMLALLVLLLGDAHAQASPQALAQAAKKLPQVVQQALGEMMKDCKEAGGKPAKSPGLLTVADLTGDGLPDFVIDQGVFNCEGAASLFSGSGGSQMSVYVGTPNGQASAAFGAGAFGVKVDKDAKPARLLVMVGGPLCGQRVTAKTARSDMKSCWRPVVWDDRARKMQFAPVSQIQPVQ